MSSLPSLLEVTSIRFESADQLAGRFSRPVERIRRVVLRLRSMTCRSGLPSL